ncbi:hypothetical protein [Roseibium sp.]
MRLLLNLFAFLLAPGLALADHEPVFFELSNQCENQRTAWKATNRVQGILDESRLDRDMVKVFRFCNTSELGHVDFLLKWDYDYDVEGQTREGSTVWRKKLPSGWCMDAEGASMIKILKEDPPAVAGGGFLRVPE